MALPAFIALKTVYDNSPYKGKYLGLGTSQGKVVYLEKLLSPEAKFAVELAKCGGGLVHIRSCYNNKYWRRESVGPYDGHEIFAASQEPVEDTSAWNCTLFQPKFVDHNGSSVLEFVHVQSRRTLSHPPLNYSVFSLSVYPYRPDQDHVHARSIVVDYESLVILPKHVAFLGDNDKYLQACLAENHEYLQFGSDDLGSELVPNETFQDEDGYVRVKNEYFGKYWRASPNNWLYADSSSDDNDPSSLFEVTKVSKNVIALRNVGNNLFCKRFTSDGKVGCLSANINSITREARFQVVEPILSRSVKVTEFRLKDARIYGLSPLVLASESARNTKDTADQMTLQFRHNDTKSSSWTHSTSVTASVTTSFQTGIPFIAKGQISVSVEGSYQYQWGDTTQTEKEVQSSYNVTVPPKSKVTVRMVASQGTCDVPFSYNQIDYLTNGKKVTRTLSDGVYTGVNSFDFQYEIEEEPLEDE